MESEGFIGRHNQLHWECESHNSESGMHSGDWSGGKILNFLLGPKHNYAKIEEQNCKLWKSFSNFNL